MATIRELLAFNLRLLRGSRTQAQMAEIIDIPMRTYVRLELAEGFPQEATLKLLTSKLGVSESSLFQDPAHTPKPTLAEALAVVRDEMGIELKSVGLGQPSMEHLNKPEGGKKSKDSFKAASIGSSDPLVGRTPDKEHKAKVAQVSKSYDKVSHPPSSAPGSQPINPLAAVWDRLSPDLQGDIKALIEDELGPLQDAGKPLPK